MPAIVSFNPIVFLAFKHNRNLLPVSARIVKDLGRRGVMAYRAVDDKHPGWDLQKRLDFWIATSDGIVVLWSSQGSKSPAVGLEIRTAERLGKRRCLVRFPNIPVPAELSREEWLDLAGVSFGLFGPRYFEPAWSTFIGDIERFAIEARKERQSQGPANLP